MSTLLTNLTNPLFSYVYIIKFFHFNHTNSCSKLILHSLFKIHNTTKYSYKIYFSFKACNTLEKYFIDVQTSSKVFPVAPTSKINVPGDIC